mmetsp:Transcript_47919/g.116552  ORF Transcript_47919/g.116552 Transcript_47919/m.116552 type:complete len:106 (+) Transcript_47919:138-455(+)
MIGRGAGRIRRRKSRNQIIGTKGRKDVVVEAIMTVTTKTVIKVVVVAVDDDDDVTTLMMMNDDVIVRQLGDEGDPKERPSIDLRHHFNLTSYIYTLQLDLGLGAF